MYPGLGSLFGTSRWSWHVDDVVFFQTEFLRIVPLKTSCSGSDVLPAESSMGTHGWVETRQGSSLKYLHSLSTLDVDPADAMAVCHRAPTSHTTFGIPLMTWNCSFFAFFSILRGGAEQMDVVRACLTQGTALYFL